MLTYDYDAGTALENPFQEISLPKEEITSAENVLGFFAIT